MTKTSLTVGIPNTLNSLEPIEIKDEQANLHAAYVERYAVQNLPEEFDKNVEGFYVLLSHINPDNTFTAYVGKTDWSFSRRLKSHLDNKDFWKLAILFKKNSNDGFTRNQTAYMEGELVKALSSSPNVTVTNEKPTGDRTFNEWDKPYMEQVLLATLRILFIRGYRNAHMGAITQTLEEKPKTVGGPPKFERKLEIPKAPVQQPMTKPVSELNPPANNFEALKRIVQRIKIDHPDKAISYKYWASNANLHTIIDAAPKTVEELSQIQLNKQWQIREYLLEGEQIVSLFKNKTTEEPPLPPVITEAPAKPSNFLRKLTGR